MKLVEKPIFENLSPLKLTLEVYGGLGKLDFPKVRSPQNQPNAEPRPTQRDEGGST